MNPEIEAAAHAVAAAAAQATKANATLTKAQQYREKVAARIAELDAKWAEIVARRGHGDQRPDDGAELELLSADAEGLRGMLSDTESAVAAARGPAESARQQHASAVHMLDRAEVEATEEALVEHAGRLDSLLLETVQQIAEAGARIGRGRPVWGPSVELWAVLRRLQAARGAL